MATFSLRKAGGGSALRGGDSLRLGDIAHVATLTDNLGVVDAQSQVGVYAFTWTDPLGGLDSHGKETVKVQTDALGMLDTRTQELGVGVVFTDNLGTLDDRTQVATYLPTVTDALGLTDVASQTGTLNATWTDLEGLLDSLAPVSVAARGPPDEAIGFLDLTTKAIDTTVQRPLSQVGTF